MRATLWLGATVLAIAGGVHAAGQDLPADKGEQLMNGSCMGCHDFRPIQTQALDKEGWTSIVHSMIEKGATVEPSDIPLLADFLAKTYGPLPEGAGKKILLNTCTVCHDLKRVKQTAATPEEWADTLGAMLNEGAMLSDQDFPVLLAYLARNFK